jgi:CDP-paratose 2-epimerase
MILNVGGGPENTLTLMGLLDRLEEMTGAPVEREFGEWRLGDQRVYVSDIRRARRTLGWAPRVGVEEGVARLAEWVARQPYLVGARSRA